METAGLKMLVFNSSLKPQLAPKDFGSKASLLICIYLKMHSKMHLQYAVRNSDIWLIQDAVLFFKRNYYD
jgi:hypothetical protein